LVENEEDENCSGLVVTRDSVAAKSTLEWKYGKRILGRESIIRFCDFLL
jgi:hypothetical protein